MQIKYLLSIALVLLANSFVFGNELAAGNEVNTTATTTSEEPLTSTPLSSETHSLNATEEAIKAHNSSSPIIQAAVKGQLDLMLRILQHEPSMINFKNEIGWTPLIYAVNNYDVNMTQFVSFI